MRSFRFNRRTLTAGAIGAAISGAGLRGTAAQQATPTAASPIIVPIVEPVALGVMVEVVEDRNRLDKVNELVGRNFAIVMFHAHWGSNSGRFDPTLLEYVAATGAVPMITWEAWRPLYAAGNAVADQPAFALARILAGDYDPYVRSWATGIATYGKPVLIRFGHEMNGTWYPWAVGANGNTVEEFIETWRYLRSIFAEAGATNAAWVWSPNLEFETELDELYPGDDLVDFAGLTGFNWGTTQQTWGTGTWQSFTEVFTDSYKRLVEISDRPIIIAETASAEEGGDKAAWITSAFTEELPGHFPHVRAVVWFNVVKETDWRLDSSPEALRAFVAVANTPYLSGELEL